MKKILSLLLVMLLALSFGACSNEKAGSGSDGFIVKNEDSVELGALEKELDPAQVYENLTYTPEMFFGDYKVRGGREAEEEYAKNAEHSVSFIDGEERELTVLPIGFKAGKNNLTHKISFVEEYDWAQVSFMRKLSDGDHVLDYFYCAYSVEGKKLIVKPLDEFKVDDAANKITYTFSDVVWEYDFAFEGRKLTLSKGGNSIELDGCIDPYGEYDYFHTNGYLSEGSKSIDGIINVDFLYDAEDGYKYIYFMTADGERAYDSIAKIQENGLFTFTVALEESQKTYQYVYFFCDDDGLVLTDGENTYYYNADSDEYNKRELNKYTSEEQAGALEGMDGDKITEVVEKKNDLLSDLAQAFEAEGIKITVDKNNGELAVDSSVLFGGDSAELTAEGKTFLNKFLNVYTSVVFSEKYNGFVSKTMVEGHTAPLQGSTYESGLPLSQERADNVKNYCLSEETGVDTIMLASTLEAVGLSNSRPITDDDGNVDKAASRRVSFRFIINIQ